MLNVNRIFRLRSTVRSDEMKAESTLPPAQPSSGRGMPTGLVLPASNDPASRAEHLPARTCPCARQTVYETNSARSARSQTGGLHTATRRRVSEAIYLC